MCVCVQLSHLSVIADLPFALYVHMSAYANYACTQAQVFLWMCMHVYAQVCGGSHRSTLGVLHQS